MVIMLSGFPDNIMHIISVEDKIKAEKNTPKRVEANHRGQRERDSLIQIHQWQMNY